MSTHHFRSWPALLDLLAATLMVFLLVSFLQKVLSVSELETLLVRQRQQGFLELAQDRFQEELSQGQISIDRDQDSLVVTFSDRVLFDSAEYRLKPAGRALIERWQRLFVFGGDIGYERVQIEGHTDALPLDRPEYPRNNWQLSAARAISVVELLTRHPGLDGKRFSANAYASFRPVADNGSARGQSLNRRIEMRIFFSGDLEEPSLSSKAEQQ